MNSHNTLFLLIFAMCGHIILHVLPICPRSWGVFGGWHIVPFHLSITSAFASNTVCGNSTDVCWLELHGTWYISSYTPSTTWVIPTLASKYFFWPKCSWKTFALHRVQLTSSLANGPEGEGLIMDKSGLISLKAEHESIVNVPQGSFQLGHMWK